MPPLAATHRLLLLSPILIAACTLSLLRSPLSAPSPTEESGVATSTPRAPAPTDQPPTPTPELGPTTQPSPAKFCDDPRTAALVEAFKNAIGSADGARLSSLVSPQHGMDARLLRDGRVVNYDRQHAAALFESTYSVDWGIAPGSGLPLKGSFHELMVPDLMDVFSRQHSLACNQLLLGGTTYVAAWPYDGIDYFSVHYAGSAPNGNMDWHTWVIGIHFIEDLPYVYAILQFKWEP